MNSQLGWKVAIDVSEKSQNGPFLGCFAAFKWACAGQLKLGSALSVRCISCVHHRGGIQRISGAVHHKIQCNSASAAASASGRLG